MTPGPSASPPNRNTLFLKIAIQNGLLDSAAGDRILGTIAQRHEIGVEKHAWEVAVELELMSAADANKVFLAVDRTAPPEKVGGFRLESAIGRGAVGTVYRAKQLSLDKTVAVKLLHPNHTAEERFVADFLHEAKAVAKLNHPNIVHAIDAGESNGRYYFAMEYVAGETLRQTLVRRSRLTPEEAVGIAEQIAAGLAHAHGNGLLHRDIKPDNILIGSDGRTRIADLGLAVPVDDADLLAAEHKKQGTPFYLSPEAAQSKDLDARSDLYSFGALLYQCLAGKPVFTGGTVKEILTKHVHQDPVPVGEASGTPSALDPIVMKLLAKDPEDRYHSADEVLLALESASKKVASGTGPAARPAAAPRSSGGGSASRTPRPRAASPASRPAASAATNAPARATTGTTSKYRRKSKVVSTSGAGIGIFLALLVIVSQVMGKDTPEDREQNREARIIQDEGEVAEKKIASRIQSWKDRIADMEESAADLKRRVNEMPSIEFRRRSLQNGLKDLSTSAQAIELMDMLDEIRVAARAERIAGPLEYLEQARAIAAEGRLNAAIEILDKRPRDARKDDEMNEQIELYLSELEEEIAQKEESDLADANKRLREKDYDGALAALDRMRVYGDERALEKAEDLRAQIVTEKAEFEKSERDRLIRSERSDYAQIFDTYKAAVLERNYKDAISAAIGLQSRMSTDEVKGRLERDLEAFTLLDQFNKDALAAMLRHKERSEDIKLELKPVGDSKRGRRYTGKVDRVEGDSVYIEVDKAVFPIEIDKLTDQTIFDLVMEYHGEQDPRYLVPLGILFFYRGFDDIARSHFDLSSVAGTVPDTWLEHMRYVRGL